MPLTEREQALLDDIRRRREDLLVDLARHVNLPTGTGHAAAIDESRDIFARRLAAMGATLTLVPGSPRPAWLDPASLLAPHLEPPAPPTAVLARLRPDLPRVLIAGHLDTVHPPTSPFRSLTIANDRRVATGPGCADMKGGLVIALAALESLETLGFNLSWTFLLNADEETGSFHSAQAIRDAAGRHDWGIALEPAMPNGELAIERGGSGQFMIEVRGRSAHVGRDFEKGISAVNKLAECITAVARMSDIARGRFTNIGPLQGGPVTNAVPDLARAWGNVRFPTPHIADEMARMLDSLATPPLFPADLSPAAEPPLPIVSLQRAFNRPAKPRTPATERLASIARTASEDVGMPLPFARTGGVCDGNLMQDAGLPTIDTLGVKGGALHTNNEWIDLESLVPRCQMLALTLLRLSQGAPTPNPR